MTWKLCKKKMMTFTAVTEKQWQQKKSKIQTKVKIPLNLSKKVCDNFQTSCHQHDYDKKFAENLVISKVDVMEFRPETTTYIDQRFYGEIILDIPFFTCTVHQISSPDKRHKIQVYLFLRTRHVLKHILFILQQYSYKQVTFLEHIQTDQTKKFSMWQITTKITCSAPFAG